MIHPYLWISEFSEISYCLNYPSQNNTSGLVWEFTRREGRPNRSKVGIPTVILLSELLKTAWTFIF